MNNPRIQCWFCGVFDGYHLFNCPTKKLSEEKRIKMGIVVNKHNKYKPKMQSTGK